MSLDFSSYSTRVLICCCRMLSVSWSLLLLGVFVLASRFFLVGVEVVADVKVFNKFGEDSDFIVGEHGTFRGGGRRPRTFSQTETRESGSSFLLQVKQLSLILFISVVIFIRWARWDKRGMKSWETLRALVDGTVQQEKGTTGTHLLEVSIVIACSHLLRPVCPVSISSTFCNGHPFSTVVLPASDFWVEWSLGRSLCWLAAFLFSHFHFLFLLLVDSSRLI